MAATPRERMRLYNVVRDEAAGSNGVACFRSYQELADRCETNRRMATELVTSLVKDGWMLRTGLRCMVPLDPHEDRQQVLYNAANYLNVPLKWVACCALFFGQGLGNKETVSRLDNDRLSEDMVTMIRGALGHFGYWRQM